MMDAEFSRDATSLLRLVGEPTYSRGRSYADTGAVRKLAWIGNHLQVYGDVAGNGPAPYTCWARLTRSADGQIDSFAGNCTCPVHLDCKHAVALVLAGLRQVGDESRAQSPAQLWERSLRGLLRDDPADDDGPTVGLQFEVVDSSVAAGSDPASPGRTSPLPGDQPEPPSRSRSGCCARLPPWMPRRGPPTTAARAN
jgi:hypothetical protein